MEIIALQNWSFLLIFLVKYFRHFKKIVGHNNGNGSRIRTDSLLSGSRQIFYSKTRGNYLATKNQCSKERQALRELTVTYRKDEQITQSEDVASRVIKNAKTFS